MCISRLTTSILVALALPCLAEPAPIAPVETIEALRVAIANARPGQVITLAAGVYPIDHKVVFDAAGAAGQPITVRAQAGEVVRFEVAVPEGFHVRAAHWTFEDLHFRGICADDSTCEHAFHITGAADHTTVRGCVMEDFNAQIKGNGTPLNPDGSFVWPDDVLIEHNELFNNAPRVTGNPVTPIDVVGGRRWIVRGNYIHDHAKGGGDHISYAAFLKGNSRDGLFERNLVVCERLHHGQVRLGLSFGGGGSGPDRICEDGVCSPEHQGGVMRNNIIVNCPADVGIYINEGRSVALLHNTLINTTGIDLRFETTTAQVRGNLLDGRIRERNGGNGALVDNLQQVVGLADRFVNVNDMDLTLLDGAGFVDAASQIAGLMDDYCGSARGLSGPYDIGAVEYAEASPCGFEPPPRVDGVAVAPDVGVDASVDGGSEPDGGGEPDGGVVDGGELDMGSEITDAEVMDARVPEGDMQRDASQGSDGGGCVMSDDAKGHPTPWLGFMALLSLFWRRPRRVGG